MLKIVIIILAIIIIGLVALQIYAYSTSYNIESYKYEVLKSYDDFELRRYEGASFSTVKMPETTYKSSSGKGFRKLASYIFGGNEKEEKIAMTSPVLMEMGDSTTMQFMIPASYSAQDLPKPNDTDIFFVNQSPRTMAAIRFSGWADDEKIERYKERLIAALKREGIPHTNRFLFAGYNPPFTLIGRRNEVMVEIDPD